MFFLSEKRLVSIMFLVICSLLLYYSFKVDYVDADPALNPIFFPKIVIFIWLVLSVFDSVLELFKSSSKSERVSVSMVYVFLAMFVYIEVLTYIGFFISSVIFCLICLTVLRVSSLSKKVAFSFIFPGFLVLLFNHILSLPLPTSPFFHWF